MRVPHRDDLLAARVGVQRRPHEVTTADAVHACRMRGVLARVDRGHLAGRLVIGERSGEEAARLVGKTVEAVRDDLLVLLARESQRWRTQVGRHGGTRYRASHEARRVPSECFERRVHEHDAEPETAVHERGWLRLEQVADGLTDVLRGLRDLFFGDHTNALFAARGSEVPDVRLADQ